MDRDDWEGIPLKDKTASNVAIFSGNADEPEGQPRGSSKELVVP